MSSYSRYLQQKNSSAIKKYTDYGAYIARKNFDHFCCCLQGETGPSGPVGLFGGTSVKYSNPSTEGWNNVITPPTGPSQGIRGNNIDATQITKIYASKIDGDNNDVTDVLKILATVNNYEKGIIKITKIDDSGKFIMMKVITVVEQTDYIEYEGEIVMATSSIPFITGETVILTITTNAGSDIRNVLTNENHEFFPLILRDEATIIGQTGATGYTYNGLTLNASTNAISFIGASSANPNNWSTVFQPGANTADQTTLSIFANNNYNTISGMPSGGIINIGKQNNIPFSIDHHGSTKISTTMTAFSGATGPQSQFVLNNTDGIRLETKKNPDDAAFQPKIFVAANYGQISISATGQGATSTQGPINITSSSTVSSSHPSSALSVDRSSGITMSALGNTGIAPLSGDIRILSRNMDGSQVKTMGLLQMQNNGNVTLQSGPGFTGVNQGILRLDSLCASGGMIIENSGDAGLNLTNSGASGMNLSSVNSLKLSCPNINIGTSSSVVDISGQITLNNVVNLTADNIFVDNLYSNPQNNNITLNDNLDVNQNDINNCNILRVNSIYQNNAGTGVPSPDQLIIGNFINGSTKYIKFGNKIALHTASSITNANNELNGSNPNNYLIGYRDTDICGGLIYRADVGSGAMNKLVTTTSLHRFSTNFFRTLTGSNNPPTTTSGGTSTRFSPPFNYTIASPTNVPVYKTLFYNTDQLILNPGVKNWWPGSAAYRSAQNPTENTPPLLNDPGTILPMKFLQLSKNQFIRVLNFTFEGYNNHYQFNFAFMGVGNRLYFEIIFGFGNTRAFETGPYTSNNAINFQKCYQVNTVERTVGQGPTNSLSAIDLSLNTVHYSNSPIYPKRYQQIPIENKAIPTSATNGTTEYYSLAPMIFIRAMNPLTNPPTPHTFASLNAGANPTNLNYTWQIINNTSGNSGNQKEALSDLPWTCPFGAQFMFEHSIPAVDPP